MAMVCQWERFLSRVLDCSGRAGRGEWAGVCLAQGLLRAAAWRWAGAAQQAAVLLLSAVPLCCASARRLHDTGRSAAWLLLLFVPAGGLWLLWWCSLRGDAGANRFVLPASEPRGRAEGLQA